MIGTGIQWGGFRDGTTPTLVTNSCVEFLIWEIKPKKNLNCIICDSWNQIDLSKNVLSFFAVLFFVVVILNI